MATGSVHRTRTDSAMQTEGSRLTDLTQATSFEGHAAADSFCIHARLQHFLFPNDHDEVDLLANDMHLMTIWMGVWHRRC